MCTSFGSAKISLLYICDPLSLNKCGNALASGATDANEPDVILNT